MRSRSLTRCVPRRSGSGIAGIAVLAVWIGPAFAAPPGPATKPAPMLVEAREHFLRGRDAEAAEVYEKALAAEPLGATLGLIDLDLERGRLDAAAERCTKFLADRPEAWPVAARKAELEYARGHFPEAEADVARLLKAAPESVRARVLHAWLLRDMGRLAEAEAALLWCVRFYNRSEIHDPDDLLRIGQAAAEYARWKRSHEQFSFLVNTLKKEMLDLDPNFWPAHEFAGRLFLEKWNDPEAELEFRRGLAINPRAAGLRTAVARIALRNHRWDEAKAMLAKSLERNPNGLEARLLVADVALNNFRTGDALAVLEEARALNPRSEETLGRIAACFRILDGKEADRPGGRYRELCAAVEKFDPHCGVFRLEEARVLETRRLFDDAKAAYAEAGRRLPQLTAVPAEAALLLLRLGEEDEARRQLEAAFERDPFHVRVSNSLKVMEVLAGYETLETPHFRIKYQGPRDRIFAVRAAKYLEERYPLLCKKFGFELPDRSLIEIFGRARNTSGHGWFSARMTGLPYLGTVGACAGKMVALASPTERPYHWGRVLQHEFVHLVNLRQTEFNLPHWFAEGIATHLEGYPRPPSWNRLLRARFEGNELFTLETINLGFSRPGAGDDWQMAYCQSELYVEFLLREYGDEAVGKLLAAFAERLDTPEALQRAFGTSQADFEAKFKAYVGTLVAGTAAADPDALLSAEALAEAVAKMPDDPRLLAQQAYRSLAAKDEAGARTLAEKVLAAEPSEPLANWVLARLVPADAKKYLEAGLNAERPSPRILLALAEIALREKDFAAAEGRYAAGRTAYPDDPQWLLGLARVHLLTRNEAALRPILEQIAAGDADNLTVRKKLAQSYFLADQPDEALIWCRETLFVNVLDVDAHLWTGTLLRARKQFPDAEEALRTAVELAPDRADARAELGQLLLDLDRPKEAAEHAALLEKLPAPTPAVQAFLKRAAAGKQP